MSKATANHRRGEWVCLCCSLLLLACSGPADDPEQAIRAWVAEAQENAEEKKRKALVKLISPNYSDARGNERDDIEKLLRLYFFRQQGIRILSTIDNIRLYDDTAAKVELIAGLATKGDGLLDLNADAYRFELELIRESDEWLLLSARWAKLGHETH